MNFLKKKEKIIEPSSGVAKLIDAVNAKKIEKVVDKTTDRIVATKDETFEERNEHIDESVTDMLASKAKIKHCQAKDVDFLSCASCH